MWRLSLVVRFTANSTCSCARYNMHMCVWSSFRFGVVSQPWCRFGLISWRSGSDLCFFGAISGYSYYIFKNRCTTQLATLSFNHSVGRTQSWRFSISIKKMPMFMLFFSRRDSGAQLAFCNIHKKIAVVHAFFFKTGFGLLTASSIKWLTYSLNLNIR